MKPRKKNTFREYLRRRSFNWQVRQGMYRHLAVQISNERDPVSALDSYQKRLARRNKPDHARIVGDMVRRLKNGDSLTAAMTRHIPQDELMILASGEMAGAGKLAESIENLLLAKERMQRVQNAFKGIIRSVATNALVIYAFLFVIGKFVVPPLATTLPADRVTGSAAILYALGDFFTSAWSLIPPILLGLAVFFAIRSLPSWTGRHRKTADDYFPYSFYRNVEGYKWLQSFAALLQSGMPETKILARQLDTSTPWLNERLASTKSLMENGDSLSKALTTPGFNFPSEDIIDDIESMQGFPDFAGRISKLATQWAVEIELNMLAKAKSVGSTLDLIMMGIMAFLYIASQSLSDQLGNAPGM